MEEISSIYIGDLRSVSGLCRVCLTESKQMIPIYNELEQKFEANISSIYNVLQRVTTVEIRHGKRYPCFICPMCLGILKIAYKFILQFENSQKLLAEYFEECVDNAEDIHEDSISEIAQMFKETRKMPMETVEYDDYQVASKADNVKESQIPNDTNKATVEIIFKQGKYSLDDLLIVEEDTEDKPRFDGFLRNLGKEISASFATKNIIKSKESCKIKSSISLIKLQHIVQENVAKTIANSENKYENGTNKQNQSGDKVQKKKKGGYIYSKNRNQQVVCTICKKIYTNKKNLRRHMECMHMLSKDPHLCQQCGFMAKNKMRLRNHLVSRHLGRNFKCDMCDKKYLNSTNLKTHKMAVHKNERPELCSICGKSFNYANALEYHMRIHRDEKKYKCTFCEKRFRMLCGYNRHLRTHTGIRPYKCHYCDKAFRSKGEVDCHEMIHTGFRPFHCKYCGKGFTKAHNMKVHIMGHPGPHGCGLCSKTFIEIGYLKNHMTTAHGLVEVDSGTES